MKRPYYDIITQLFQDIKHSRHASVNETFATYSVIDPDFENVFMNEAKAVRKDEFKKILHEIIIDEHTYTERTCNLLSNLCLANQLYLMEHCMNAQLPHYKTAVGARDYDINVLLKNTNYHHYIANTFYEEKFDNINEMDKLLGVSCLTQLQKGGYIHHTYDLGGIEMKMPHYLHFKEAVFAPYFDMLINYSQAKEEYLVSKNIALPTITQADEILNILIQGFDNECSAKDRSYLHHNLSYYTTIQSYHEMQQQLPVQKSSTKKAKI